MGFLKRLFGAAAPAADAIAREIVRSAVAQGVESAKARARAKYAGTVYADVATAAIDELAREIEALVTK